MAYYEELVHTLRLGHEAINENNCPVTRTIYKDAADAIEDLSVLIEQYGGETGIKNLQEYANKYWKILEDSIVLPKNYKEIYDKCGDYVYIIDDGDVIESVLVQIVLNENGTPLAQIFYDDIVWVECDLYTDERHSAVDASRPLSELGKTWFFTKEEASRAAGG